MPSGIFLLYILEQSICHLRSVWCTLLFSFYISGRSFCKQTVQTQIRHHVLRRLIRVYTVCLDPRHIWVKLIMRKRIFFDELVKMGRAKRICYLSPMRAAKVQASLRIRAVSPEPSLLAHTSSELRGTFRQKAKSLAPLNGWACAVKICHDGMLEDTNSLGGAHIMYFFAHSI